VVGPSPLSGPGAAVATSGVSDTGEFARRAISGLAPPDDESVISSTARVSVASVHLTFESPLVIEIAQDRSGASSMALGITDHVWSIAELMQAAQKPSDTPPIPRTTPTTLLPGTRQFRLIVGRGGKGTNKPR
jgi:hypothetical protein